METERPSRRAGLCVRIGLRNSVRRARRVGSLIGKAVTAYFQTLGIIAGVLIILLGLHFLGLFRISLLFREARFQTVRKPGRG